MKPQAAPLHIGAMTRTTHRDHRSYGMSTIGTDMSIKYPYAFTHMSISPYGRDVVLAGRAGLAVVDLEFPLSPPRTIPLASQWKLARVAWSPNIEHHGWVATPVSQTLLIHDLAHTTAQPMRVLKAHPTAITDIAWMPKVPAWIGTSSIDPVIKIWDVRRDQKPVWYFSKWEPADLLAFNNVHQHKMASAHRNSIAIWDIRYGSGPLLTMNEAHADDIASISWHPNDEDTIISAGQDRKLKRWNVRFGSADEGYSHAFSHEIISAKYLPFGEGILLQQKSPDNVVTIIKDGPQLMPVHRFVGHTDTVVASEWRMHGSAMGDDGKDARDFQLVTWGDDQVLRMWSTNLRLIEAVGCEPSRLVRETQDPGPSFATNFLGPEKIMHLVEQKALPSELLLAAASGNGSQKITTIHEYSKSGKMLEGIRLVSNAEDNAQVPISAGSQPAEGSLSAMAVARTNTTDEHSSDDDDDDDDDYDEEVDADGDYGDVKGGGGGRMGGFSNTAGHGRRKKKGSFKWQEEVTTLVGKKYHNSKLLSIKDMNQESRQCHIAVGVPWITRDVLVLRATFPPNYPSFAVAFATDSTNTVFGSRASIIDHLAGVADACAAQGTPALEQCLYSLFKLIIPKARSKGFSHGARAGSIKASDLERLPPPPPALMWEATYKQPDQNIAARNGVAMASKLGKLSEAVAAVERQHRRENTMGDLQRWAPSSLPSEEDLSTSSNEGDDYSNSDLDEIGRGYYKSFDSSDSSRESGDDYEEDDDFDGLGYDDGYEEDNIYYSDISQSDLPVGFNGLPISLRHANNRDRFDAKTPFPRLCGGVFSGPGTLICFFASIYTSETYPEQSGLGQQAKPNREKTREDMYHQMRRILKPRNLLKLKYYQGMVQFGLQNRGTYLPLGGTDANGEPINASKANGARAGVVSGSLSGFGDSDDDAEARDEEVPRYYFRKQISHNVLTESDSEYSTDHNYFRPSEPPRAETGVGNMAMICQIPEDRSARHDLATQYMLTGDSLNSICLRNSEVAEKGGRRGLAHIWAMLSNLIDPAQTSSKYAGANELWVNNPPIFRWLRSVMIHYERCGDVQTLALISCILSKALSEAALLEEGIRLGGPEYGGVHRDEVADVRLEAKRAINKSLCMLDLPPWMAAATAANPGAASLIALPRGILNENVRIPTKKHRNRGRVGWDILDEATAEEILEAASTATAQQTRAISRGGQLTPPADDDDASNDAGAATTAGAAVAQRVVSFVTPELLASAVANTPANTAANALATAAAGAADVCGSVDNSGYHTVSPSRTPSVHHRYTEAGSTPIAPLIPTELADISLFDSALIRRSHIEDESQYPGGSVLRSGYHQRISGVQTSDALTPSVHQSGNQSTLEPLSPEILQELNSEEIKLNEIMMAVGPEETSAQPGSDPAIDPSALVADNNELHRTASEFQVGSNGMAMDKRRNSSEQPNNEQHSVEPDGPENLWRRLRSNVLGRVHTTATGGKSNSLELSASPPAPPTPASTSKNAKDAEVPKGKSKTKISPKASNQEVVAKEKQSWMISNAWVPLLGGKEGVAAQAAAKEMAYLRSKREFERLRTRVVVHDVSERPDIFSSGLMKGDYRAQAPYLDHWKLLYARILYKWELNTKAIEVLKCIQDPVLREFYNQMYYQPTVPKHDNQPRIGNPDTMATKSQRRRSVGDPIDAREETSKALPVVLRGESEEPRSSEANSEHATEIGGTPWLACAWCHEYVHGRALICHACGHGGHQEHMQRWFSIVRKQLLRSGMAPTDYACMGASINNSNSSSSSNLRRAFNSISNFDGSSTRAGQIQAMAADDDSASFVNSPAGAVQSADAGGKGSTRVPELTVSAPEASPETKSGASGDKSARRNSNGSKNTSGINTAASSSSSSSSSSDDDDDDDNDSQNMGADNADLASTDGVVSYVSTVSSNNRLSFGSRPDSVLHGNNHHGWESSDGESDDHLHTTQSVQHLMENNPNIFMNRRRSRYGGDGNRGSQQQQQHQHQHQHQADLNRKHIAEQQGDAMMLGMDIPTCPSGCGCNCLYESRKLVI
ncbi:hypothetical protein GGI07_002492 [Coemansia sp. Benny D115]|nr:hypothetical protein GGI07_002492 [Coemansia sp. Benny D115]